MGKYWKKWITFSMKAANVQARVMLTIFYCTFFIPFGLIGKAGDSLKIKNRDKKPSYWDNKPEEKEDLPWARRQF